MTEHTRVQTGEPTPEEQLGAERAQCSPSAHTNRLWEPEGGQILEDQALADRIEASDVIAYEYAHADEADWLLAQIKRAPCRPTALLALTEDERLITYFQIQRTEEPEPKRFLRAAREPRVIRTETYVLYEGSKLSEAIDAGAQAVKAVPQKGGTTAEHKPGLTGWAYPQVLDQVRNTLLDRAISKRQIDDQALADELLAQSPIELG